VGCVDQGLCLTPVPLSRAVPNPSPQPGTPARPRPSPVPPEVPDAQGCPGVPGCPASGHRALPAPLKWCKTHLWRKTSGQVLGCFQETKFHISRISSRKIRGLGFSTDYSGILCLQELVLAKLGFERKFLFAGVIVEGQPSPVMCPVLGHRSHGHQLPRSARNRCRSGTRSQQQPRSAPETGSARAARSPGQPGPRVRTGGHLLTDAGRGSQRGSHCSALPRCRWAQTNQHTLLRQLCAYSIHCWPHPAAGRVFSRSSSTAPPVWPVLRAEEVGGARMAFAVLGTEAVAAQGER